MIQIDADYCLQQPGEYYSFCAMNTMNIFVPEATIGHICLKISIIKLFNIPEPVAKLYTHNMYRYDDINVSAGKGNNFDWSYIGTRFVYTYLVYERVALMFINHQLGQYADGMYVCTQNSGKRRKCV